MVRYGGPRFEFYTLNQYLNHNDFIERENKERVRSLHRRRKEADDAKSKAAREADTAREEKKALAERQEQAEKDAIALRERRLKAEAEEAKARRRRPDSHIPISSSRISMAKLSRMAEPKKYPEAAYGGHMYGRCMYQSTRVVEFPIGRAGACYCPGVDRDRIVPGRPDLTATPPWTGSYSTHNGFECQQAAERAADDQYYLSGASGKTFSERMARSRLIGHLQAAADADAEAAALAARQAAYNAAHKHDNNRGNENVYNYNGDENDDDDDIPSIFSHGSSNGPIEDMGTKHMTIDPTVTRPEVELHLSRRGERTAARLAQSQIVRPDVPGMTLPQLTHRVVRLQKEQQAAIEMKDK